MRIPSGHKIPGRFAPIFLWKKEDNYVKIKNKELYMCNICARCSKTMLVFWEILLSLSASRVWIEILLPSLLLSWYYRHSPRGGCGLKSSGFNTGSVSIQSLSARRVWIEIWKGRSLWTGIVSHSPRGGCGLKYVLVVQRPMQDLSLSARRVWIEIGISSRPTAQRSVTLREEGVD